MLFLILNSFISRKVVVFSKVAKSCPALCNPMYFPPDPSKHGISQASILEWVVISFSRRIFPTQGSNPCLLHWQANSLPLSHLGSAVDKKFNLMSLGERSLTGIFFHISAVVQIETQMLFMLVILVLTFMEVEVIILGMLVRLKLFSLRTPVF